MIPMLHMTEQNGFQQWSYLLTSTVTQRRFHSLVLDGEGSKRRADSSSNRIGNGYSVPNASPRRGWSIWVILVAFLMVIALLVVLLADRLFHPGKFQINEIEVKGEFNRVDGEQIKQVVESYLVGNYFSASLSRLESHIEALPWVFSASLRRVWPSTLQVEIIEVKPVAKWGQDRWVNFTGDLVKRQDAESDVDLPRIDGPESEQLKIWENFKTWSNLFAAHGLSLNLLRLNHGHLWYLDVSLGALAATYQEDASASAAALQKHSVEVVVERTNAQEKIERLIDVLKEELLLGFASIRSIDLRYPNGFAVEWFKGKNKSHGAAKSGSGS
ncbi:MAG: FtsQ-type POTRA domain-containing protein [Gammaproteobacteria bacterium]|nr:FtsQ-type POTRA domain-containing protein [Gammaproteobacteria bacterium]